MLLLLVLSCATPPEAIGHAYRLNHRQWDHTVVDLLGLPEPTGLSEGFVPDPASSTFDTHLAPLTVSPVLWQQYQDAAAALAERAVTEEDLYAVVVPDELQPWASIHTPQERDAWIEHFGHRAFRRPLEGPEVEQFAELFDEGAIVFATGDPFADGVQAAVTGFLVAPGFLYRTEGLYGTPAVAGELSPVELASRLSYALWNTMPDDELLAAAESDGLTADTLREQAERMLDAPQSHAMLADLHRQLLHVDSYSQIWRPSEEVLGIDVFQDSLPAMMQQEVYAFVDDVIYGGGTVRDLLTLPYTYANSALAEVYGVEGVDSEELVPVNLDPNERAGLLTMSGFLAWRADTTQPNLIGRGGFVNDALLCADLPPPPASATPLPVEDAEDLTLRELIEAHTSECGGSCHNDLLNPVGFAFGVYDHDGYYAPMEPTTTSSDDEEESSLTAGVEDGIPIDASGTYAFEDGSFSFVDAVDLAWIMSEREQVHRCYAEHLAGYLEGATTDNLNAAFVDELAASSMAGTPIRDIVLTIVTDPEFRQIRP